MGSGWGGCFGGVGVGVAMGLWLKLYFGIGRGGGGDPKKQLLNFLKSPINPPPLQLS